MPKDLQLRALPALSALVLTAATGSALAESFNEFGSAATGLVAPEPDPDFIFELGGMGKIKPAYEGSSTYEFNLNPIISVERFRIPGLIDIGGDDDAGFSFSPAADFVGERKSADYSELTGLDDVDATFALGAKVGYDFDVTEQVRAGVYGELLYGFGGSQGLLGEVGAEVTAKLTPELELAGGVSASFASESYMDAYFGVSVEEAARTGGRLAAYDPSGGIKSVSLDLSARYEFIPDTFFNLSGSYTHLLEDAASSPITQAGSERQFTVGLGISRRFSASY